MGHAYDQMPIHKVEDQRQMINRSMDILERFTGTRPVGWLGPGLTQTLETPEILVDAGVKYIGDWVYDDEPTVIRTAKGARHPAYTVEINDITMMIVQHHESEHLLPARQGISSTGCMTKARTARRSWRSHPPLYHGSRTGSNISSRSTTMSAASTACCTGTARRSSTGTRGSPARSSASRRK